MMITAAAGDSDSDDPELPDKEPEFIVHVVDDHRPPAPPRQMYRPAAAAPYLPPVAPLDHGGGYDGPRECTWCFFTKCVHFAVVMGMVVTTVSTVTRLPEEYRTGEGAFLLVGPIIIGVLACSWIALALFFDKERC
ncbi:unnamed protein product [Urochloa decumbens]|uniref:Transmembrane protein n=1 Tax=Urochloa decumbens TaxID=240449 RepID=A0ABC9GB90_9POAL